ncbi:hypothetical protein [Diaphorobacter caeni]|uniref:hypothetical protein n=1 Tax=Diaphorobacter caeni TaxID=2784387 RepID=UPI0018906CB6|nr:hypothetical protein [Diaphorobacter caeni]MBF5006846.1 hypothetical protein [Diaphorobacter caeni]
MTAIREFKGLNNVTDPVRLGLPWLTVADNVDITESGAVRRREGFALGMACAPTGIYSTRDEERCYFVEAGALRELQPGMSAVTLATGLARETHWTEFNDQTFFVSGDAAGIVRADGVVLPWRIDPPAEPALSAITGGTLPAGRYRVACTVVLPDGRESAASSAAEIELEAGHSLRVSGIEQRTGAVTRVYISPANSTVFQLASAAGAQLNWNSGPEALGQELQTDGLDALPRGVGPIAEWSGSIYAAMYLPEQDQSVVWRSEALAPHLWNLSANFFMVPGRVHALAPHDTALIVGTDRAIHAYTPEAFPVLADYGTVAGMPWALDGKRLLIWTKRGLCQFPEFTNLTERRVSVAPGTHAGAAVIEAGGQVRFVASLHAGGSPFNKRGIT